MTQREMISFGLSESSHPRKQLWNGWDDAWIAEKGAKVAGTDAERAELVREALAIHDRARQQRMAAWIREHDGIIDTPCEDLESELDADVLNDDAPTSYLVEEYRKGHETRQETLAEPMEH